MRMAIIGGTGVYDPHILADVRDEAVVTPYGRVDVKVGTHRGEEIAFLARHGYAHSVPPHRINYRANMAALLRLGVHRIIATSAVGSLNPSMAPGDFVVQDQFLDFTKGRASTFFDGGPRTGVVHVDYTQPYCPEIREALVAAFREAWDGRASPPQVPRGAPPPASAPLPVPASSWHSGGCYVCTEGPRFETPAEIRMFRQLGGDLVGMTNVPEVVLARECQICYAAVSLVTNFAAGISPVPLTHQEVLDVMEANTERLKALLVAALTLVPAARSCRCGSSLGEHGPVLERIANG